VVPLIDPERISWPDDGMHRTNDIPYETLGEYIAAGRVVICNGNITQTHNMYRIFKLFEKHFIFSIINDS
jgi:hypothetical protein